MIVPTVPRCDAAYRRAELPGYVAATGTALWTLPAHMRWGGGALA